MFIKVEGGDEKYLKLMHTKLAKTKKLFIFMDCAAFRVGLSSCSSPSIKVLFV